MDESMLFFHRLSFFTSKIASSLPISPSTNSTSFIPPPPFFLLLLLLLIFFLLLFFVLLFLLLLFLLLFLHLLLSFFSQNSIPSLPPPTSSFPIPSPPEFNWRKVANSKKEFHQGALFFLREELKEKDMEKSVLFFMLWN